MLKRIISTLFILYTPAIMANDFLSEKYWKSATVQTVKTSIAQGNDVNARDVDGFTVLMMATSVQADSKILQLLVESGADVNATVTHKVADLMLLPFDSNPNLLKSLHTLLKSSKDVQPQAISPLMLAIFQASEINSTHTVSELIKLGADVNFTTSKGITPLMLSALYSEDPSQIQILIDAGANIHAKNFLDQTALDAVYENIYYQASNKEWQKITAQLK